MSSPTHPSAIPRALSPGAVMVWDSHTESFSPHSPLPHSSMSASSQHGPYQASSPTTSTSSARTKRLRHHSNPESILDFDEFLKQVHGGESLPPPPLSSAMPPTPSTKSSTSGKNPLKTVLKEVLGGGGNNASQPVPKDAVVYSFGRGGVARTTTSKGKSPTTANLKRDPYYAFVPFGSPPSPTYFHFPPNSINPYAKAAPKPDPYTSLYGSGDNYYYSTKPLARRTAAPSPAPTMSSTNSTSDESSDGRRPLKISTANPPGTRQRSKSFTSPTTPAADSVNIGVFVNPEQAALEAKLLAEEKKKGKAGAVKVVVSPVLGSDDGHHRGRSIDVISVDESEADAVSLSGFPAPPTSTFVMPIQAARASPPPRPRTVSGNNHSPHSILARSRLPTMPPPNQPLPPLPTATPTLHKARSLRSIDLTSVQHLPPVPSKPPPPRPELGQSTMPLPAPYPPIRRGSAPPSALPGFAPQLPPIVTPPPLSPDVVSLLSSLSTSPSTQVPIPITEEMMLQKALERERQRLEERVRGLMRLVETLEEQKQQSDSLTPPRSNPSSRSQSLSVPEEPPSSPSTVTDKRSSTSTERAVTYLPYLR